MGVFSKGLNDYWQKTRSSLGVSKFMSYSSYDTFILVIFTLVLTVEREYGMKAAKLTMEWFDIDDEQSISNYLAVIKQDKYLTPGDRPNILRTIMKLPITSANTSNFSDFMSAPQWFAAMIFVNKSYIRRDLGDIDDSALFPSNITRERTESYLNNPTKLPIFQHSVNFVEGIPFIGSNAMKLHLIAITTSLLWYSNEPVWNVEHKNMWVRGDNSKSWLERRARLNLQTNTSFNKGGIW